MFKRLLSTILAISMLFTMSVTGFAREKGPTFQVISQEINSELQTSRQIAQFNDTVLYTFVNSQLSYCSQTTSDGRIRFSYVLSGSEDIYESGVYYVNEICALYNMPSSKSSNDLDAINNLIIKNLSTFNNVSNLEGNNTVSNRGYSTLSSAVSNSYGSNYSSKLLGTANKSHNGTSYSVRCTESQTTSMPLSSKSFAKDTLMTSVVSWALSGSWTWIGAVKTIVFGVVTSVVVNGYDYVKNSFTAERSNVSIIRTRIVTVSGNSQTQYWAGWTIKRYFFKGDLGWSHDNFANSDIKHIDFDNVSRLIDVGFQNFVEITLG